MVLLSSPLGTFFSCGLGLVAASDTMERVSNVRMGAVARHCPPPTTAAQEGLITQRSGANLPAWREWNSQEVEIINVCKIRDADPYYVVLVNWSLF